MRLAEGLVRRWLRSISRVKKPTGSYPRVHVEGGGRGVVSQAGGVLLVETVRKAGLDGAISAALSPWRVRGGARSGQDPAGCGARRRAGRGLPGRCGPVAGRAGRVRACGLGPHGLSSGRQAGVRLQAGLGRAPHRPRRSARTRLAIGRGCGAGRVRATDRGHRRRPGLGALGEAGRSMPCLSGASTCDRSSWVSVEQRAYPMRMSALGRSGSIGAGGGVPGRHGRPGPRSAGSGCAAPSSGGAPGFPRPSCR